MDKEKSYDIVMDMLMAVIAGYYIYMVADQLTDGKFSRELSVKIVKIRGRIKEEIDRESKFRKLIGATLFDAITIVEDRGYDEGGNGTD